MSFAELWEGFCSPPDEARPRAWWHWMDGNVDLDGIRLDLEWLHAVGVRGVQMFEGGMGTPLVVPEPVEHGSSAWHAAVRFAAETAQRLGLEFAVATSPGWSAAGGPWVDPADAMKKVVWSSTVVDGGGLVERPLPPLPDVAGPFQDCPRWGAEPERHRYSWDWLVLAVPAEPWQEALTPSSVSVDDWACLVDGAHAATVALPRDPDGFSTAAIEQVFDEPVRVAAVTVGLPGPRGFAAAPSPDAVLEVSDDGLTYRRVAELPATTVPVRTVAFEPVTARRFRLVLSADSAAAALPRLASGVTLPPVLRTVSEFLVSEFALWPGGRLSHAELKAGFGATPDYYALGGGPDDGDALDPARAIDVSAQVDDAGTLRWEAPPGRWRILRFGASLTGQTNGPAPADATGLEVDKLDADKVRRYLDTYLGHLDGAELSALLSDSIESGPQNWTDRLLDRFRELRGYDPRPWLPALAGYVVRDHAATDAFLWDYRRTVAELLASDYYTTIAAVAHDRGLSYYAEALEDHRPQLGDDLAMRAAADVPMGAMWMYDPGTGAAQPTYVADLKGASSVAHVYGKPHTGAESMTGFHRPWSYTPKRLKHVADLELALGVTRFCIHTSPHQPTTVPPPGIGLSPYLSQAFIRTETWADLAGPWVDYLARCSFLLNAGTPAADIAYFVGEEAPVTALFGDELEAMVPYGFDYDFVNVEALEDRFRVDNGALVAGTARYRLLYLGGSSRRMTVRALRRLEQLVTDGATVVGRRPDGSPSLADDAGEHERLCKQLWGAGRVMATDDLAAALRELGVTPELSIEGAELPMIGRRVGAHRLTFVTNPRTEPVTVVVSAAGTGSAVWDPVELRRWALPETEGGYLLTLPALGSVFVLPDDAPPIDASRHVGDVAGRWQLTLPGADPVTWSGAPRAWTDLGYTAFSGVGTYRTEVAVAVPAAGRIYLALGTVADIARVRVNGRDCGIAWTEPFRVDVTDALRSGRNVIEIDVANAWMNRLIAEARDPSGAMFAPVATVYAPDAQPRPSGLLGPVTLTT
ncbi:MAG TPA: glycosyl hydrolase [Actinoplanes sp.]